MPLEEKHFFDNDIKGIISATLVLADGRIACAGETKTAGKGREGLLLIFDPSGQRAPIRKTFSNYTGDDAFLALTETVDGSLLLAGESHGKAWLCRTDEQAENGTTLSTGQLAPLKGLVRLGDGSIMATSLENGQLLLHRIGAQEISSPILPWAEKDGIKIKYINAVQADPNTGGAWICGQTVQGRTYVIHIKQDGREIDNNRKQFSKGDIFGNMYVCQDGSLLLSGVRLDDSGGQAQYGYVYQLLQEQTTSLPVPVSAFHYYTNAICRAQDKMTFVHIKSTHDEQPDTLLQFGKHPSIKAELPHQIEHSHLLTHPDGTVWLIGNKKDRSIYFMWCGRTTPSVTGRDSLTWSKKARLVSQDGSLKQNDLCSEPRSLHPSGQPKAKVRAEVGEWLKPGERASIGFSIENVGQAASDQLTVLTEVVGNKSVVAISPFQKNLLLPPLERGTSLPVYIAIRGKEDYGGSETVTIAIRVLENGLTVLTDSICIFFKPTYRNLNIISPKPNEERDFVTKDASQTLTIEFYSESNDSNNLQKRIRRYVGDNEKPINQLKIVSVEKEKDFYRFTVEVSIDLNKGINLLKFNILGQVETKLAIIRKRPDIYLLAIGQNVNGLKFPAKDAQDFAQLIDQQQGNGEIDNVYPILVSSNSRDVIVDSIDRMEKKLKLRSGGGLKNDYFIFYYSGHGSIKNGNFAIPTIKINQPVQLAVELDDIFGMDITKILFIDACRPDNNHQEDIKPLPVDVIFYSCALGQNSHEPIQYSEQGNSYFTSVLLKKSDNDDKVSIKELQDYLEVEVPSLTGMNPIIRNNLNNNPIIFRKTKK